MRIVGTGTAFDAPKQLVADIEDAISYPVNLPSADKGYQDVLTYARTEVNYAYGVGLYMSPSAMLLHVSRVTGYNNQIVIATSNQTLGLNAGLNASDAPPANSTGETSPVKPQESQPVPTPPADTPQPTAADVHADEKTALVVGEVAISLGLLWPLRRQPISCSKWE